MTEKSYPGITEVNTRARNELNRVLLENNWTLIELFRKIAIRCEDLVYFCDIHRKIYFSDKKADNRSRNCCDGYFNPEPFFTRSGTCFTTHQDVREYYPFLFSS